MVGPKGHKGQPRSALPVDVAQDPAVSVLKKVTLGSQRVPAQNAKEEEDGGKGQGTGGEEEARKQGGTTPTGPCRSAATSRSWL